MRADDEPDDDLVYAGFWIRVWAAIIDSVLLLVLIYPVLGLIPGVSTQRTSARLVDQYGQINYDALAFSAPGPLHILFYWVLPAAVVVVFWICRAATPGKMAIGARIVDAASGGAPSATQFVVRYLGYYVSTIALFLGLIWAGIDARKQGWHDKIARTVVVRRRRRVRATARFDAVPSNDDGGQS